VVIVVILEGFSNTASFRIARVNCTRIIIVTVDRGRDTSSIRRAVISVTLIIIVTRVRDIS